MYKIMFVCTGNICRSPMGEFLLKDAASRQGIPLEVASSGISDEEAGKPIDRRAKKVLAELNIATGSHQARQFTPANFDRYDLLLAMDTNHYRALKRLAPTDQASAKIRLLREFDPASAHQALDTLGIYDPWYGGQEDFYETFKMISSAVPGVLDYVRTQTSGQETR